MIGSWYLFQETARPPPHSRRLPRSRTTRQTSKFSSPEQKKVFSPEQKKLLITFLRSALNNFCRVLILCFGKFDGNGGHLQNSQVAKKSENGKFKRGRWSTSRNSQMLRFLRVLRSNDMKHDFEIKTTRCTSNIPWKRDEDWFNGSC